MKTLAYISAMAVLLASCGEVQKNGGNAQTKDAEEIALVTVDTMKLQKGVFHKEVVSTGKLRPFRSVELRFGASGILAEIPVRNGDSVRKGDVIASLDRKLAALELEAAANALEKAELSLKDIVVGYSYGSDTSAVPKELLSAAKIKSGYKDALLQYKKAAFDFDNTVLTAPFDGVVANLSARVNEKTPDVLCRLSDPSSMEVEFTLLESEMDFMEKGTDVTVTPFSLRDRSNTGKVTEVNPLVDEKGQVKMKARINPPYGGLMPGMSVKVFLSLAEPGCYVVPKSAVVLRDGYNVVFLYDTATGKASWLYVDVLQSNSREHVISGCKMKETVLPENGWVITSGNLNLADGTDVAVRTPGK